MTSIEATNWDPNATEMYSPLHPQWPKQKQKKPTTPKYNYNSSAIMLMVKIKGIPT